MMGVKAFHSAAATIAGIGTTHMIRKGQIPTSGATAFQIFAEIAEKLPVPSLNQVGRGVYSLFADQVTNEATAGIKSQFIGITQTVNLGSTLVERAGNAITVTRNGELQIRVGKSEMRMTSDGVIRMSGDTLYLEFDNGIERVAGAEIIANAPKIKLN